MVGRGTFGVEGMNGDFENGKDYFPFRDKVQTNFPGGILLGGSSYFFQVDNSSVVLSAQSGWQPIFSTFQDSPELRRVLEEKLEVVLE